MIIPWNFLLYSRIFKIVIDMQAENRKGIWENERIILLLYSHFFWPADFVWEYFFSYDRKLKRWSRHFYSDSYFWWFFVLCQFLDGELSGKEESLEATWDIPLIVKEFWRMMVKIYGSFKNLIISIPWIQRRGNR